MKGTIVDLILIPHDQWNKLLVSETDTSSSEEEVLSLTIEFIKYYHNQHVGIPIIFLLCLARDVLFHKYGKSEVIKERCLYLSNIKGVFHNQLLSVNLPEYWIRVFDISSILDIVEHLSIATLERIGKNILFCKDAPISPFGLKEEYRTYSSDFNKAFIEVSKGDFPQNLIEAIITAKGNQTNKIVNLDFILLSMVEERLNPLLKKDPFSWKDHKAKVLFSERNHKEFLPKEGGLSGIRRSSRLSDIEDMLISEMIYPDCFLADKLLNESFFIKHRPPKARKKKNILFLGVMLENHDTEISSLMKASWFNYSCWVDIIMKNAGLQDNDTIWLEGDRLGGVRWFIKQNSLKKTYAFKVDSVYKKREIYQNKWFPNFFDNSYIYEIEFNDSTPKAFFNIWVNKAVDLALSEKGLSIQDYSLILCQILDESEREDNNISEYYYNLLDTKGSEKNISFIKAGDIKDVKDKWKYGAMGIGTDFLQEGMNTSLGNVRYDGRGQESLANHLSGEIVGFWLDILKESVLDG